MAAESSDRFTEMTTSSTPAARTGALSHRYGKVSALGKIDLDIPSGCMAGFIGPDGVGKSTLLGIVAGAIAIQQGEVSVLGGDMRSPSFRRSASSRIAYMPQGLGKNLYPTLTVFENVDFFARLFGLDPAEKELRIREVLQSTGLLPFSKRQAGKLSGGMKQKLGLCCSLIHDPDLLILDEPTTGVDPLSRRQFWELIARIRGRRPGLSVMVATAYMDEAEQFDWLAAMDDGSVLATGTPDELKQRTGSSTLEESFIALLPETKRSGHRKLAITPRSAGDSETVIVAEDLTRKFDDFTAVDRVNFRIGKGEIFGFLGSNGCGKTTTMKMLTGLLPATDGRALLFGKPIDAKDPGIRRKVGYMSQSFSLYSELTVEQNLKLHARLFNLEERLIQGKVDELTRRFELDESRNQLAGELPMGIRQRLSLAVAIVHDPAILILDEPTSGVDPVARDRFWEILADLSRNRGVTIFISTHFMNEGERCDRISLMHAGRVLACDAPERIVAARSASSLEAAFISCLEEATSGSTGTSETAIQEPIATAERKEEPKPSLFSLRRCLGYARRESIEILRDPVRLVFALAGSLLLMLILGLGITFDVRNVPFAVLDLDNSPESREYIENIDSSSYFLQRAPSESSTELFDRLKKGELKLAIEISPGFGRELRSGRKPEIAIWIDGAMPFFGETLKGYASLISLKYFEELAVRNGFPEPRLSAADITFRYRYNQDFNSLPAMVPAVIPLLLLFIPSILMALGIVREKELGSITNLYVTPVTRLEFLVGKQIPYMLIGMVSFFTLVLLSVAFFRVPVKGSFMTLVLGTMLYVVVTTAFGQFISSFTSTQIAALALTAFTTIIPTIRFCGFLQPVSSLDPIGALIGNCYPATYYLLICRGVFAKGLGFFDLLPYLGAIALFIPALTLLSLLLLKKQGA
ncbi:MAG: ribosome-associated ATPase/putative transporter RbbA [Chlorobiaceae bacterium]|nr:ribosome-associated ATPase/putative transporter RbbA [Chlorobiaceae bacterium]